MRLRILIVLSLLLAPLSLFAQPLADRLPADALIYVGWQGVGTPAPGYAGSHLQALLDGSNIPQLVNEFAPQVAKLIAQKDPEFAQAMPLVAAVGKPMWVYPSAFYFGGIDMGGGQPMPRVALLIDAGADADKVLAGLGDALAKAQASGAPLTAKVQKGVVVLAVGAAVPLDLAAALDGGGKTLAKEAAFKAAMDQVPHQPIAAMYVNFEGIWGTVDHFIAMAPDAQPKWVKIRDAAGLAGIKSLAVGAGFDGKDWATGAFLAAPSPRTGFLKMLEGQAVKDDFLKLVPKTSNWVAAGRFRPAAIVDAARAVWPMAVEQGAPPIEAVLQQVSGMLGFDVEKDFLAAFGDEWGVYTDPMTGGNGLVGTVLVHRAVDGAKLEQSLGKLEQMLNAHIAANLNEPNMTVAIKTQQVHGVTVHYLAIPFITPSWTMQDGNMYVGLYPQTVVAAADFAMSKGPSILDNEQFQAVRKRLAVDKVTSVEFMDLARIVPDTYGPWVAVSRIVGAGDLFGLQSPLMVMPPIRLIMEHLEPAGTISWVDDAGFHAKGISPFPGSEALGTDVARAYLTQAPIMAGFMLPSLGKARESAKRVKDASQLRQIGQGCQLYGSENNGKMPPDLGTILLKEGVGIELFVSPLGSTQFPSDIAGGTMEAKAAWVTAHSDYVYQGGGKSIAQMTSNTVAAYAKMEIALQNGGSNVLFGDGHVEWLNMDDFQKLLPDAK